MAVAQAVAAELSSYAGKFRCFLAPKAFAASPQWARRSGSCVIFGGLEPQPQTSSGER
jgi:hypothetical protein